MADARIQAWLAMDPETRRVLVQVNEFDDGNFPRGLRGLDWPRRTTEINEDELLRLLSGAMPPKEMDDVHRRWWDDAAGPGEPEWPHLPGEAS